MTKFSRIDAVQSRYGISRSTIYEEMAAGRFPKPVKIGPRAVAWVDAELEDWAAKRIAEREAA